jgi:nitroreductase
METLEAIRTRRSIRKFTAASIPDELVNKILEAAMYAPSARDTQPWHFIVVNKKNLLHKIPRAHPHADMVYEAPLAIIICGDTFIESIPEYLAVTCSAATQNLLLAAHDLGLGGVWLGLYPRKERMKPLTQLFDLPENIIPISMLAIGYPNETPETPERFKKSRIHFNVW